MMQQPGSPEQLKRIVEAAEESYENTRVGMIVYWDDQASRYRMSYQSLYKSDHAVEVIRIPYDIMRSKA